jgi:hypothetical protein
MALSQIKIEYNVTSEKLNGTLILNLIQINFAAFERNRRPSNTPDFIY